MGRLEEAAREMKPAAASDPLTAFHLWELGMSYYFARQPEKAIEQFRRATVAEPDDHGPHLLLGWTYEQQGKFSEAIEELKHARRLNDHPQILIFWTSCGASAICPDHTAHCSPGRRP